MSRAQIIKASLSQQGWFTTTTKNTDLSQRENLEEVIVNLTTVLGAKIIHKRINSRGSYFYEVQYPNMSSFQSASNTILELSRRLSQKTQNNT